MSWEDFNPFSVENRIGDDVYNPDKGRVQRDPGEFLFDWLGGQREEIQKKGIEKYEKLLRETKDAETIRDATGAEIVIEYDKDDKPTTTEDDLKEQARKFKRRSPLVDSIIVTGKSPHTREELYGKGTVELGAILQKAQQDQRRSNYQTDPGIEQLLKSQGEKLTLLQDAQREASRQFNVQAEANRDEREARLELAEQTRLDNIDQQIANREVTLVELGMKERMQEKELQEKANQSRKERVAAIIAGLASLGGAFII